jgi:hypothetical protein
VARAGHASCLTRRVMLDLVFIVVTLAFFAAAIAYATACDRV